MSNKPAPQSREVVLPPLPDGGSVIKYAVLAGSRLALISGDVDAAWRIDNAARFAGPPATARIWVFDGETFAPGPEFLLGHDPYPQFDQFPDGRWLVVHARTNAEPNARILDASGVELRRIMLGDGIWHMQIGVNARIWVGWFDEGVFGNSEWRYPGLKYPPSAHGLAAFDQNGVVVQHASDGSIADCYALNVVGAEAWACTYTDFPIRQLGERIDREWPTTLRGTQAIAVDYPHILAVGGYEDDANRAILMRLGESQVQTIGEWRLPLPVERSTQVSLINGRDDEIHAVHAGVWRRWRVSALVCA